MNHRLFAILALGTLALAACGDSSTDPEGNVVVFEDDFESGLGKWEGRPTIGTTAELVADPLGTNGDVLRFSENYANGDLFSSALTVDSEGIYEFSFDYLGLCTVPPGGLGGFVGVSDDLGFPTGLGWIAGTEAGQATHLIVDDGEWHTYSYTFTPADYFEPTGGTMRVMLEDFEGTGGASQPRDAYFDNLALTRVSDNSILLEDDFESGLGQWVARSGSYSAEVVTDPVGTGGKVVRFADVIANGDILSPELTVEKDVTYQISFDYLGLCRVPPGGLGGFIGFSDDITFPTPLVWIGGTEPGQALNMLVDDGEWHSYSFTFAPSTYFSPTGGTVRIMLEDFEGTASYSADAGPRDAYFDNIRLVKP